MNKIGSFSKKKHLQVCNNINRLNVNILKDYLNNEVEESFLVKQVFFRHFSLRIPQGIYRNYRF